MFTNKVPCFSSHICYYLSLSTCYKLTVIYQVPVMDVVYLRYSWISKGHVYCIFGKPIVKVYQSLSDLLMGVGISADY